MYSLIQTLGLQTALKRELVPFVASFAIAEFLYKFHSFTLECAAFLATWAILSFVQQMLVGRGQN